MKMRIQNREKKKVNALGNPTEFDVVSWMQRRPRKVANMTNQDIADAIGCSIGCVKVQLQYARMAGVAVPRKRGWGRSKNISVIAFLRKNTDARSWSRKEIAEKLEMNYTSVCKQIKQAKRNGVRCVAGFDFYQDNAR